MSFRKNTTVRWKTPRGGRTGVGRIKDILQTPRGVWYEVEDEATKSRVRLRAANITPA